MSHRYRAQAGRRWPAWAGFLMLAGCSGGGGASQPVATPTPMVSGSPTAEVGSVTITADGYSFRTLATGDAVDVATGSQGTYHLWGSVRFRNLAPDRPRVRFIVRRADNGRIVSDNPGNLPTLKPDTTGTYEYAGLQAFLCTRSSECPAAINALLDQQVFLRMELEDSAGRTASDERQVVVRGSPLPTPAP